MPINKIDFSTATIETVQGGYQLGWVPTNWASTGVPSLPAGAVYYISGTPYQVQTGDVLPSGSPANGDIFIKITPNVGDSGATADAEFSNTFSGTWSDAYNGYYDGTSLFLNFFCTKSGTDYTGKGFWMNYREKTLPTYGNISITGQVTASQLIANISLTSGTATRIYTHPNYFTSFSLTYEKKASAKITRGSGIVQVLITLLRIGDPGTAYARIYVNGVPVGTERSTTLITQTIYTEDIPIDNGDEIEIWLKCSTNVNFFSRINSFLINCSETLNRLDSDYMFDQIL